MGYTHYWRPNTARDADWEEGMFACRLLIRVWQRTVPNARLDEVGALDHSSVTFNGTAEQAHETFVLSRGGAFGFCKTNQKPYDQLVVACLCAMHFFTGMEVSSDGSEEEWVDGAAYARDVLGEPDLATPESILPRDYED